MGKLKESFSNNKLYAFLLLILIGFLLFVILEQNKIIDVSADTIHLIAMGLVVAGIIRMGWIGNLIDFPAIVLLGCGIAVFSITNKWPTKFDVFCMAFSAIFIYFRLSFNISQSVNEENMFTTSWPYTSHNDDSDDKKENNK